MATLAVGESLSSYEELHKKVGAYQKEKCVQLTHRDSRELEAASKWVQKRVEIAIWSTLHVFLVARIHVRQRFVSVYRQLKFSTCVVPKWKFKK